MRKKGTTLILTILLGILSIPVYSQSYQAASDQEKSHFQWPEGRKMGLSLTFDDARLSQIDNGIPILDMYGIKGTFYISPDNMVQRLEGWKKAAADGHDIGNHSLVHPCTANFDWSKDNALENYTLTSMTTELDSATRIIRKLIGIDPFSYAYPCGMTFVGKGVNTKSYVPVVASMFETGRLWLSEGPNDPAICDLSQITGMELDGKSFDQIKNLIESAKAKGQWLVLAGHEMDTIGAQTSLLTTIEAICQYASDPANGIWIDNVHNIASYIKEKRGETPFLLMQVVGVQYFEPLPCRLDLVVGVQNFEPLLSIPGIFFRCIAP